jgi:hypothetical protein
MRFARFGLLVYLLLFNTLVRGQQSQSGTTAPSAIHDPQAVNVLNQALAIAGGAAAIMSVSDYTGIGNVTYPSEQNAEGTVIVRGLGGTEIRIDSSLSSGVRSWAVSDGIVSTKDENGHVTSRAPKTNVPSSDALPDQTPLFPSSLVFPYQQLVAISNAAFNINYNGITQVDGHSVHDIYFQQTPINSPTPGRFTLPEPSREIFIDTSTFQIIMMKETLPKSIVHQVHYSNYQLMNGVLMPLTISEDIAGQAIWTIQFTTFNFNTGLQASSFALQ